MGRPVERPGTWYSLIHASLAEEAAETVLSPYQAQSLMARLRAEHIFSTPPPDSPRPGGGPCSSELLKPDQGMEPGRSKKQPPCPDRGDWDIGR